MATPNFLITGRETKICLQPKSSNFDGPAALVFMAALAITDSSVFSNTGLKGNGNIFFYGRNGKKIKNEVITYLTISSYLPSFPKYFTLYFRKLSTFLFLATLKK